jgi:hypothetical protein
MRVPHRFSAVLAMLALGSHGCGTGINEPPPSADHLQIVRGDDQTGFAGRDLPVPLRIRVIGSNGRPLAKITVRWSVLEGDAALQLTERVTDATGEAETRLTLGLTAGWIVVMASVENTTPVAFSSRAVVQLATQVIEGGRR